jgi:hypothetical protein
MVDCVEDRDRSGAESGVAAGERGVAADDITDEEAARLARERYREEGLPVLQPDSTIAPLLTDGETVIGWRPQAGVSSIKANTHAVVRDDGPLYVTSSRLLHLGRQTTSVPLVEIDELAMADNRILVTIAGLRGLMLDVELPRQFRVLLAAAKGAAAAR